MATEVKVPSILIPGIGSFLTYTDALYDKNLKKSQSDINNSISTVEGLIDQINNLQGGTVQQATNVNVTAIAGLSATTVQAALAELVSAKANSTNAVFHTVLEETVPQVEKIVADIANMAYTDAQGHDLVQLYNSVLNLSRDLTRLKTRIEQDEVNYLSKSLNSDTVIVYGTVEIARFSKEFSNFKNLRSNGKDVLTEHQNISHLAPKEVAGKSVLYTGDVYSKSEAYSKTQIDEKKFISEDTLCESLNEVVNGVGLIVCSTPEDSSEKIISISNTRTFKIGMSYKVKFTHSNTVDNVTVNLAGTSNLPMIFNGERVSSTQKWEAGDVLELWSDGVAVYSKLWLPDLDESWYGTEEEYKELDRKGLLLEGVEYNIFEE